MSFIKNLMGISVICRGVAQELEWLGRHSHLKLETCPFITFPESSRESDDQEVGILWL